MAAGAEIVVVGAGAAGIAAAIAAARSGVRVALLERRPSLGGTVSHALLHTIAGLYDGEGNLLNPGLPAELTDRLVRADPNTAPRKIGRLWVLNADPDIYRAVVGAWLEECSVAVFKQCGPIEITRRDNRVASAACYARGERLEFEPAAVIDCTGDAEIVASIGPDLVEDDETKMLAGLIFRIGGVPREAISFPANISLQRAMASAAHAQTLPPECANAWFDSGVAPDEIYLKLSLSRTGPNVSPDEIAAEIMRFLADAPGFAQAKLTGTGEVTPRSGRRIRGEYRLTVSDVRELRRFEDSACRCSWPIEYWDPDRGVALEYLRDNGWYEIPMRSLKVAGLSNVWAAGKCFSSDHLAQASARVAGCCWAMGEAAATTAVGAIQ